MIYTQPKRKPHKSQLKSPKTDHEPQDNSSDITGSFGGMSGLIVKSHKSSMMLTK